MTSQVFNPFKPEGSKKLVYCSRNAKIVPAKEVFPNHEGTEGINVLVHEMYCHDEWHQTRSSAIISINGNDIETNNSIYRVIDGSVRANRMENLIGDESLKKNYHWEADFINKNASGIYRSDKEIQRALFNLARYYIIKELKAELLVAEAKLGVTYLQFVEHAITNLQNEIARTGKIVYKPIPINRVPGERYWSIVQE